MKKVILTIAALLVSAIMVFSFAGCTDNKTTEPDTNAAVSQEDVSNDTPVVAESVEDSTNA